MIFKRNPVVRRRPVTKEWLAVRCSQGRADESEKRIFHDMIINLIRKNASKYYEASKDNFEDLVQDCFVQMWQYLHTFDPRKARLSTWVWVVCRSVLNQNFSDTKRYRKHVRVSSSEVEFHSGPQIVGVGVNIDIKQLLDSLYDYCEPDYHNVLQEMFGGKEHFVIPEKIVVAEVARRTKKGYTDVHRFYNETVRPFFEKRLVNGDACNG